MREILFRGKRKDNGEWVYWNAFGDICTIKGKRTRMIHSKKHGETFYYNAQQIKDFILCNTIGQYTGLTDKNGTKIFEGDIVHILGDPMVNDWKDVDYVALIAFLDGGFCALDGTVEDYGFRRYALERMDFYLEVIGNIYDNPELMEVQNG